MEPVIRAPASTVIALLEDFSLEMTGADVPRLEEAGPLIPPGTRINVTYLAHEDLPARSAGARAVRRLGFVPVPHISARRLGSRAELEEFLAVLRADGTVENVLAVGGDPAVPRGPYDDALAVIGSGLLPAHGVRHVGVGGYPDGHPAIAGPVLWAALEDKVAALDRYGQSGSVITQFAFDAEAVLSWVQRLRERGIDLPVRVGVPGPAGIRRLLACATRFGVGTSASIARKYGFSLTNLVGMAGPDRFLRALASGYDPRRHGRVKLHFYPFGGLAATARWIADFRTREEEGART